MQLDTTVTYSGLPQDEWDSAKYSKKTFNSPMSPQAAAKNASNACKHTTTFMVFVVIFGFSVAFIIPLLVSSYDVASSNQDTTLLSSNRPKVVSHPSTAANDEDDYDDSFEEDLHPSSGKSFTTSRPSKKASSIPSKESSKILTSTKSVIHPKITSKTTKPVKSSFKSTLGTTAVKARVSTAVQKKTTKVHSLTNTAKPNKKTTKVHSLTNTAKPNSTAIPTHGFTNTSSATTIKGQEKLSERSNTSSIISKIIHAIYENGNGTSGSGSDKDLEMRIKALLKSQPSLQVIIFGTVAIFLGMILLLVGISCIHQRRKAANRRVKFQDVVTDLQSADKVVLLSSDISEEE